MRTPQQHVALGIAGALFLATALYMALTYHTLPNKMPMQWDGHNIPTWYATREVFIVWMATILIGLNLLFCLVAQRVGELPPILVVLNGIELFGYHMIYQQVAPKKCLFIPVNVGTIIILIVAWVSIARLLLRLRHLR